MQFKTKLTYLGNSENNIAPSNGREAFSYRTLNFYDFEHNEMTSLNVVDNAQNYNLISQIEKLAPSTVCTVELRLVPRDKLFRLQLLSISA